MPWMVSISLDDKCRPEIEFDRDILPIARYTFGPQHDTFGPKYAGTRRGGMSSGLPAPRELIPTSAKIVSDGEWAGCDFLQLKFLWGVSKRFKDKVEELEPGVHEFFPIDIKTESGGPVEDSYYLLNVCNRTNAIDETGSVLRHDPSTDTFYRDGLGKVVPKTVFHKEKVAGMCMWRDARISKIRAFISDALMDSIQSEKMFGLDAIEVFTS